MSIPRHEIETARTMTRNFVEVFESFTEWLDEFFDYVERRDVLLVGEPDDWPQEFENLLPIEEYGNWQQLTTAFRILADRIQRLEGRG